MLFKGILIGVLGLGTLWRISRIGEPREPITGAEAMIGIAVDALIVFGLLCWC